MFYIVMGCEMFEYIHCVSVFIVDIVQIRMVHFSVCKFCLEII